MEHTLGKCFYGQALICAQYPRLATFPWPRCVVHGASAASSIIGTAGAEGSTCDRQRTLPCSSEPSIQHSGDRMLA